MSEVQGDRTQTVGNYTLLETVGQGTFGEVMLAMERHTRESVAVKVLEKCKITDDDARQRLMNEIAILHRVQHPNLLHLLEAVEEVDAIYLVTEYVGGGELFAYIVQRGKIEEAEASRLFAQMVAAVDTCHRQLVIHRDLKPENILLDAQGNIKVIDFGLGTMLSAPDEVLHVACGSPHYAAPEMLLGGGYLGQRIDMWSLGVCLYAMVCGCLPFDEPEVDVLYDRIIAGDYDFSPNPQLSSDAKQLIRGLLHMPPEQRLTSRAVLSHRWLRASGAVAPPSMNPGLAGAVVDPACRQLVRLVATEFGYSQREVLEALRKGERSSATATYFLVRQRELRKGTIKNYSAMLPRPPPPRLPTARRRPVPANLRAAAARLPPPTLPALTHPMAGLRIDLAPAKPAKPAKPHARDDSHAQTALAAHVQGRGAPVVPPAVVHESGALTDRVDRDGAARRTREMTLPAAEATSRRGHGGAMPLIAPGKAGNGARVSEIRPLHGDPRTAQQGPVNAAALGGISGRRAARFPVSSPRGKV